MKHVLFSLMALSFALSAHAGKFSRLPADEQKNAAKLIRWATTDYDNALRDLTQEIKNQNIGSEVKLYEVEGLSQIMNAIKKNRFSEERSGDLEFSSTMGELTPPEVQAVAARIQEALNAANAFLYGNRKTKKSAIATLDKITAAQYDEEHRYLSVIIESTGSDNCGDLDLFSEMGNFTMGQTCD